MALRPTAYNRYYEPFVGGGAMFFSLEPQEATINDMNPHLINLYQQVRDNLDQLLLKVHDLFEMYTSMDDDSRITLYYQLREEFNQRNDDDVRGASLFLFLNKTCYNGVYRENASGKFNVPHGNRKSNSFHELHSIMRASEVLKKAIIRHGGYQDALRDARAGDFIYLDPPYVPLSSTSNFTQYLGANFGNLEHIKLKKLFQDLDQRGCLLMMSNSDTKIVKDLYKEFNFTEVMAERAVNCKALGRGKITELVITNY
jgi:DNA adenine methylase